ncbi:hypothetical protein [Haloactinospora alba]|uniref:hypothetical protein n=1 Tax=Haloactinospora alba TaxID=405555 RepID=UPI00114F3A3C|nr:hypothetical protein [Haloactinospora alba]
MNTLLPVYLRAQVFIAKRRQQLRSRLKDEGAGIVEYAALVVLAGAIIATILGTGLMGDIDSYVDDALSDLLEIEPGN